MIRLRFELGRYNAPAAIISLRAEYKVKLWTNKHKHSQNTKRTNVRQQNKFEAPPWWMCRAIRAIFIGVIFFIFKLGTVKSDQMQWIQNQTQIKIHEK